MPDHHCVDCGTDRLPNSDLRCAECSIEVPTVAEYRAAIGVRDRLPRVASAAPPATMFGPVWDVVDEVVWQGHRFELVANRDSGAHRILVDGAEVWDSPTVDTEAAQAELARRIEATVILPAPDSGQGQGSGDGPVDDDVDPVDAFGLGADVEVIDEVRVDRLPIRDDWQRSPGAALDRLRELTADAGYRLTFRLAHPWRTSWALVRLWWAGLWWLTVAWARFTFDRDETGRQVRAKALGAPAKGSKAIADRSWLGWRAEHQATIERRVATQLGALVAAGFVWVGGASYTWQTGAGPFVWLWWTPGPELIALAVVLVWGVPLLVGKKTRPPEAGPVLDTPITVHRRPDLRRNPGLILDGFEHLGGSPTATAYRRQRERGVPACTFREDLHLTATGAGLVCKVRTPEPAEVMLGAAKFPNATMAKAIGFPTEQVKLTHDPDDEADVVTVFVSRRPLRHMDPGPWPLLKAGTANYFESIPLGVDEYGEAVRVCLNERHMLTAGLTGSGKTTLVRTLLLGLVMDPRVRLFAYFKGGVDGTPFDVVGHRVRKGNTANDLAGMTADLEELQATAIRRQRFQETHPELFPTGALDDAACNRIAADPALAAELDEHAFYPIVVVLDEARFPMTDSDIKELLTWFALQARAVGISLVLATQKPDAKTIPTNIRGQCDLRLCLRVDTSDARDAALGGGVSSVGVEAFRRLAWSTGYLVDPDQAHRGPFLIKAHTVGLADTPNALARSVDLRRARGLLSGLAAGEAPADPTRDTILDHIAALPRWGDKIHGDTLADLLAVQHALYAGGDAKQRTANVLALLRNAGVPVRQVEMVVQHGPDTGERRNRMGIHRTDFDAVLAEHFDARARFEATAIHAFDEDPEVDTWMDAWTHTTDHHLDTGADIPVDGFV